LQNLVVCWNTIYVVGIGIGFLILLGLAANARTARLYEGQDITGRYESSIQPRQERVVVHHVPPPRRHVYQPYVFSQPDIEDEEPITTNRKRRRFPDLNNLDICDNWGFLD